MYYFFLSFILYPTYTGSFYPSGISIRTCLPTCKNEEPDYFRYSLSTPRDNVHVSLDLTLHRDQRVLSNLVDITRANRSSRRQETRVAWRHWILALSRGRPPSHRPPLLGRGVPRGFATSRTCRLTSMGAGLQRTYAILRNPRDLSRPVGSTVLTQKRRKTPASPLRGKGVDVT